MIGGKVYLILRILPNLFMKSSLMRHLEGIGADYLDESDRRGGGSFSFGSVIEDKSRILLFLLEFLNVYLDK